MATSSRASPSSAGTRDAALLALSGRITLDPITDTTPERIVTELWEDLVLRAARAAPGPRVVEVPSAVRLPAPAPGPAGGLGPLARRPKVLDEAPALYRQGGGGGQALTGRRDGPAAGTAPPQGAQGTTATVEQGRGRSWTSCWRAASRTPRSPAWPCASPATSPRPPTATGPTTSTWTAPSRCSPSGRCRRTPTSSSASGCAPAARSR